MGVAHALVCSRGYAGLARYHVFPDPPGPKIGNGGATLYTLEQLDNIYGAELDTCESARRGLLLLSAL